VKKIQVKDKELDMVDTLNNLSMFYVKMSM